MGNSVGRTSPRGRRRRNSEEFTRAGASVLVIYTPSLWNVANMPQQVDTAICVRVLYRAEEENW